MHFYLPIFINTNPAGVSRVVQGDRAVECRIRFDHFRSRWRF